MSDGGGRVEAAGRAGFSWPTIINSLLPCNQNDIYVFDAPHLCMFGSGYAFSSKIQ